MRCLLAATTAVALLVSGGCTGELRTDALDASAGEADAFVRARPDASLDVFAPPGADAALDAFVVADLDAIVLTDASTPCAGVTCGANAACNGATGMCACNAGFTLALGECVSDDPQARTASQVCTAWRMGHQIRSAMPWTPGSTMCAGSMPAEALDDVLRRVNVHRWLAGLPSVALDTGRSAGAQECAIIMGRQGDISHMPPTTWPCYTATGATIASQSNLALGHDNAADAVNSFIDDSGDVSGTNSLGHRRWMLNGRLGPIAVGYALTASCIRVLDTSGSTSRTWTAWPPPGPVPREVVDGMVPPKPHPPWWSFLGETADVTDATVVMTRATDGRDVTGTIHRLTRGFGPTGVAWAPTEATNGMTYHVTVTGTSLGRIHYDVTIVTCP